MRIMRISMLGLALLGALPVLAAETIAYTYDAKGRLVKIIRTGTVNHMVTAEYTHDKADNRTRIKITNSTNTPP